MAGAAEREAVKQRTLIALEDARRALAGEMTHLRPYMHPRQLLKDSVRKHRIAYIIGAAAAGFVALRVLLMPRAQASNGSGGGRSIPGRLVGLMGAALWPLVRGPVTQIALRYLSNYLPQFFPPTPTPTTPEATE
jgi:hypothetical protein